MEEAYATWIALFTIGGLFGISVIGYVCWKDCKPTYSHPGYEAV